MPELHVLRVFCGEDGSGGNPLGVYLDGQAIEPSGRQAVAKRLGYSETVFVDDQSNGQLQIFTPAVELPFAGHPLVGAAWLLAQRGHTPVALRPPAGEVPARVEGDRAFVAGRPEWQPDYELLELGSREEVEALDGPPPNQRDLAAVYAPMGDDAVRVRVFPVALGIAEDEATGSAAIRLGALLDRPFTIHQGVGSVIEVTPREDGYVEIGGLVVTDHAIAAPPASSTDAPATK
jgi:predicted PhzF superfamily epimerase YddE/YHI9